jgi:glycosyltransferase involved in cell wall biosynthesis
MFATPEFLLARPIPALVPVEDARGPLRVVIASLAHGGAERIVLEWLDAEARRSRGVELAVLHARKNAWRAPAGVAVLQRNGESPEAFVRSLAARWRADGSAISTHLVDDALLSILWEAGLATIPTVHNARDGWRNDPAAWPRSGVPFALACAESVRREMRDAASGLPVHAIRHMPAAPRGAGDRARREALRAEWNIAPDTLLVGTIGSFKPQKDFPRAVEVLGALRASRDAALVILGGVLDARQLAELDRTVQRVADLDLAAHVKLPGFVDPIGPWYAACDVVLSASRYEGLSMAAREALAAGLRVVALDVGGQSEIGHDRLDLLPATATAQEIAGRLAHLPVRTALTLEPAARSPRVWSVAHAWRAPSGESLETLFVTANLNAGGAQRSLVNLAAAIGPRHRLAVAVCGETTHDAFAAALREAGIRHFRPTSTADPFGVAESLLAEAARSNARVLCFWNADPRVRLLVAKFAPARLRIVDASPGAYAFEEMERERPFAGTITYSVDAYYARLDTLVLKHQAREHPHCPRRSRDPQWRRGAARPYRELGDGPFRRERSDRPEQAARDDPRSAGSPPRGPARGGAAHRRPGRATARALLRGSRRGRGRAARTLSRRASGARAPRRAVHGRDRAGNPPGMPERGARGDGRGDTGDRERERRNRELVRDGETGWLLPEDAEASALARAMRECARSPEVAQARATRSREHVARHFSMDAMAHRYLDCFAASVS